MAAAKRRVTKKPTRTDSTALRLRSPSDAIAALLRERCRLLKAIAKKQAELEAMRESERSVGQSLFERMQPLVREHDALQKEIRALFDALLAEGRLSHTARKKVAEVYRFLEDDGVLEPVPRNTNETVRDDPDFDFDPFEDNVPPQASLPPKETVGSAKHAGGQPGNETLRGLFRRLAVAFHPDLVQQEHEQKRRTDVMKEVTRAYEEGDLARLLEIEQLFLAGKDTRRDAPTETAKCAELERAIAELKLQQRAIAAELKAIVASSPLTAVFGRRVKPSQRAEQLDDVIAAASEELEPLRQIRQYVKSFSEGKITLTQFYRGPDLLRANELEEVETLLETVLGDLELYFDAPPAKSGRTPRGKAKPGRATIDDLPF